MGVNQRKEIDGMNKMKSYLLKVLDFYDGFYKFNGFSTFKF